MKNFIFITSEGYTYQPNSQSAIPDIENMQVIGFGQARTVEKALKNMVEENKYLRKTNFDEVIGVELKNSKSETLYLKESFNNS